MESAYEYNSGETLKKGCWRYESFKTTEFRCWSREFLCAALEVTLKTVDGFKRKKGIRHEGWYQHFNTLSGSPQGDREEEINWVTKMRWNDPKLLYWEKDDAETLGNKMLERVYFLIDKNNIDSLRLIFDHYKASGTMDLMKQECNKIGNDITNIRCKLAVVFDRMEELMIDSADISWNPGASGPPRTREELAMLYLLQPKVYEIMNIGSKTRNKTLTDRLKTMFQSLYDNALNQNSENVKNHFGKFGSIYANVKHDCTETYNNDFEEITCYLSLTFSRMETLSTALGADFNNWKSSRSQSMRAVILIWLLLTPKGNFYVKTTTLTRAQSAKVLLNVMYNKLRENDLNGLQEIANLIPNDDQMGLITSGEECDADFDTIMRSMKCGFRILIEHLGMYLEQYNSNTQNTKRVDLTINHETRLKQFQISSIKDEVRNTELELKNSLEEFSSEIKTFIEGSVEISFLICRNILKTWRVLTKKFPMQISHILMEI